MLPDTSSRAPTAVGSPAAESPGSPTSPKRRAAPLPPEERRAAIIDAVLPELVARGRAVTTRQLAGAAGVSEGTIFNVFTDKDELIRAAVERALDQAPLERAIAAIDADLPLHDRLVEAVTVMHQRTLSIWQLVSQLGAPHPDRTIPTSAALTDLFAAHSDEVRVDPADAARFLRAFTLASTHPVLVADPSDPRHIVDMFLNGVRR